MALPLLPTTTVDAQVRPNGLISQTTAGAVGGNDSYDPAVSANGRFVAFTSRATNLVANDNNGLRDIFLRDRTTGVTTLVSRHSDGSNSNANSYSPDVSADGRYVVFHSAATNLVDDDTNGAADIFRYDSTDATVTRVSVRSNGAQSNGSSYNPSITGDGLTLAFQSSATNLVPNDTNGVDDVFVHATSSGATSRVSTDSANTQGNGHSRQPRISADGTTVVFQSAASNLVPNDTNAAQDVFAHNRGSGATSRASVGSDGTQVAGASSNPDVSGDGSVIVFASFSDSLVVGDTNGNPDIFVRRTSAGVTEIVSQPGLASPTPNAVSQNPSISEDGKAVVWVRLQGGLLADELPAGPAQVYLRSLETGATQLVSTGAAGRGNLASNTLVNSTSPAVGATTNVVAFTSRASNLVPGDTNNRRDIFVSQPYRCAGQLASVVIGQFGAATAGPDVILGTIGSDTINGLAGDDVICGAGGNDLIRGGTGNDSIFGGIGADELTGGPGNDDLRGGPGNDKLFGRLGDDKLRGGADRDVVSGHGGNDLVDGGSGADKVNGGSGIDLVVGGAGNDVLRGHADNDRLDGGRGFDLILGHNGDDLLLGRLGNDRLFGGNGNDKHFGGPGTDTCVPGAGADIAVGCEN